jgi:acyl-coenzyme A synthetase/AMP-(fatty) acid ligase
VDSLGFDLLDRHVVDGRGDDIACTDDDTGALTFAQLLERSAALAGGLQAIGVGAGDVVAVRVEPGNLQVQVVCACVRLGAVPGETGDVCIVEESGDVTVRWSDEQLDLALVAKAGRTEPAPSLPADAPGFRDRVRAGFADLVDVLQAGAMLAEATDEST